MSFDAAKLNFMRGLHFFFVASSKYDSIYFIINLGTKIKNSPSCI